MCIRDSTHCLISSVNFGFNFCKISFKSRTDVNRPEDNQTRFAKHLANPGCRSRSLDNKNQKCVPLDLFHCNNGISILLDFRSPDILKQFSTIFVLLEAIVWARKIMEGWAAVGSVPNSQSTTVSSSLFPPRFKMVGIWFYDNNPVPSL